MEKDLYPKYKVSWIWNKECKSCGVIHRDKSTWTYHTPEEAMNQALFILHHPEYTLLSVDQ